MEVILTPLSQKAKSRVGKQPVRAVVEQVKDREMFVVISPQQCRWVNIDNDPDFEVEIAERIKPTISPEDDQ